MSNNNKDKHLITVRVTNSSQVELMRQIYNENLDMLATITLPHRSAEEQLVWWKKNKKHLRAYLFKLDDNPNEVVGFISLTDRGSFITPILAIRKCFWGKGYGTEIIDEYLRLAKKPLAGSQLVSNSRIRYMNKKAGWQVVGTASCNNGEIELLYHPNNNDDIRIKAEIISYLMCRYQP